MYGDGIVIMTPLFQKYMELGLVCTDIEWVLEYTPKRVFENSSFNKTKFNKTELSRRKPFVGAEMV